MIPHVIGASGRSGAALCRALLADQAGFVPVVRDAARWEATGLPGKPRLADIADPEALRAALAGATHIVSCAHARHAAAILEAAPAAARFVFLGSTRKFTAWPDDHGDGVIAGEAAFLASGRPGMMLHPTMIYGANGENNVARLAALLRRTPILPLPNAGRALVQPIHQSDVTASILAALRVDWTTAETLIIAGPQAMTYADFARSVAAAAGLARPTILNVPAAPLRWLALLTRMFRFFPLIGPDEIRRLTEDKAFDITGMRRRLGIEPIPLGLGLGRDSGVRK